MYFSANTLTTLTKKGHVVFLWGWHNGHKTVAYISELRKLRFLKTIARSVRTYLSRSAKKKVMTGRQFVIAAAKVAEV